MKQIAAIQSDAGLPLAFRTLFNAAKTLMQNGKPLRLILTDDGPARSDPQRNTFWMWHAQVASELTIRTGKTWTKDDVHDLIFLARYMPRVTLELPNGEIVSRPVRTSEKSGPDGEPMREVISNAMNQYLAWIFEMGIEVTIPDAGDWR